MYLKFNKLERKDKYQIISLLYIRTCVYQGSVNRNTFIKLEDKDREEMVGTRRNLGQCDIRAYVMEVQKSIQSTNVDTK